MKIYREGREIYEIKDYKQIGKFMEVATIEATIKSALPIDIQVGDYVIFDYNNLKYTLYDVYPAKKQARSSTYGEAFVYDLKFKADTEHLSICPFLDLVPNDNNLTYSSLPSFSTFENVYGIADRLQANLDYLYPNQWRFDVVETTDAELLETLSDAREFAISGESCLEGLRKIYDIWGVGFIHSVEDGVNVITIGKSAGKTSLFRYGKGRGLRTIKKNLQNSDQLCTRAYVFGSTRNIPARWYNNKGYIGEAQYAPNLMIPPSKWADGIPQGAYIDAIFDGVNRIEKYGLKIKTLSYDGSDSKKDEIYPSVEKMTAKIIRDAKAEIGENTYIPFPTLYPDNERMDMVLEGSNITDDGTNSEPGYVLHSDKIVKSIEGESETITIAEKKGESKYEVEGQALNINICTFDIEKPANYRIRERLDLVTFKKNDLESTISAILTLQTPSGEYIELRKLAFTDKLEDSLQIPDSTHELKEAGKYTLILKLGVTWTTDWVVPQIGEDVYLTYNIAETDITLSRGERILDNFFTIKIKQIGFDINDYTASSGAFKNIHFRSGMCSGMSFNIAKCSYIEESDAWELKCKRVEDSSISQRFPNSIFNIAKDDRFVLLDINMPDLYVYTAMQRLYDTALEDLKHFSTPQYVIEPQIDNIQMARSPQVLKEGMYMTIDDLDIAILNEEALIDSVTITNRGTDLRSFEVTLRNDKVYNRYNKLADRIADLESTAQKTASNNTITPVQDTSESKIETPAVGFDENALADYLEENKYTTEGDVTNLLSPIDKEVSTLRTDFDNLNTLLNGNVGGVIDTWNEVVSFLDGCKDGEDLATILRGMNTDIANRVLIEDFEKLEEAVLAIDISGLSNRLDVAEQAIKTNATAIATNATNITNLNNRVKTLEDLGLTLEGDAETGYYIKSVYSFVSQGEIISGRRASGSGSGGGGGISEITAQMVVDALGYVPYSSQNPSGYITETELSNTLGGYQTKITSSNKLAYSLISGTPTLATVATSGKYSDLSGVPTSLPASDVYAWAKAATKPSYTASEVGALSETGGTVRGVTILSGNSVTDVPLNIATPSMGYTGYIRFGGGIETNELGHLGFSAKGVPAIRYEGVVNTLYHTGNFNPANYLPLSGGTISGNIVWGKGKWGVDVSARGVFMSWNDSDYLHITHDGAFYNWNTLIHSGNIGSYNAGSADVVAKTYGNQSINFANNESKLRLIKWRGGANSVDNGYPGTYMSGLSVMTDYTGWQMVTYGSIGTPNPYFRSFGDDGRRSEWKQLAFLTDNVASATKLQTARTIWGQSFDGTGNVSGSLAGVADISMSGFISGFSYLYNNSTNGFLLGSRDVLGGSAGGAVVYTYGDTPIDFYTGNALRMHIHYNGNVLIGTTTDNGSGAKLQVNGRVQSGGYALSNSEAYYCGLMPNSTITNGGTATDIWLYNTTKVLISGSSIELQANTNIAGNLTATGEVISSRRASSSDARLKDNINRLIAEDCLAMVRNLQPSSWDWGNDGKHSLGFIAQDVEQYMPYAVTKIKDDKLGEKLNLQYDQFIALAIGGVQAVDNEVQQLKKEVAELKRKLSKYETVWQ